MEYGASRKHEWDDVAYELLPLEFLFPGQGIVEPVAGVRGICENQPGVGVVKGWRGQ